MRVKVGRRPPKGNLDTPYLGILNGLPQRRTSGAGGYHGPRNHAHASQSTEYTL